MTSKTFLAKGKRGVVYLVACNGKKAVIKEKRPESTAINAIENEAHWLRILNKHGIGPKFRSFKDNKLIMEYVEGELFLDWLAHQKSKFMIKKCIKEILKQCYIMDRLGIEKKEMHRPVKHLIIRNSKPVMIDFERCRRTLKPSNVTQFCQYLRKLDLIEFDQELLQAYQNNKNKKQFNHILSSLK